MHCTVEYDLRINSQTMCFLKTEHAKMNSKRN